MKHTTIGLMTGVILLSSVSAHAMSVHYRCYSKKMNQNPPHQLVDVTGYS